MLENCTEQLKDIQDEYKDDAVKIRIRSKEFCAPQYLIETIKQKIYELIYENIICQYEKIGNSITLTDNHKNQLYKIAKYNYCRIEKLETKLDIKVYSIPKALSTTANVSSSIVQQSNELTSSLSIRQISVLKGSIEIYLRNTSDSISVSSKCSLKIMNLIV